MQVGWVSPVQDRQIASFRYRVEAPTAGLNELGHQVEAFDPAMAEAYDVVVFSKAYGADHRTAARQVKRRGGRVVFDICDNHFYNPFDLPKYRRARDEISEMLAIADRVVCSTPKLAEVISEETGGDCQPIVIGDVVERVKVRRRLGGPAAGEPLRLTWFGSHGSPNAPSGMTDLQLIREELEALNARRPVELTVCSNSRAKFEREIAPFRLPTRYVEWSLDSFPRVLAQTDAAVVPMNINPFTACKTHNRLTTALWAGVPVIASGIDSYREFGRFCTLDDFEGGLEAMRADPEAERQRALASRAHIDQWWSTDILASHWEAALSLPTLSSTRRLNKVRLHGRLDAVADRAVTGWVRAPAHPDLPLHVVLECDGEPVSIAVADRPRDDLRAAGLDSACGFSLPLPPRLAGAAVSHLAVRVLESDWIVGENPIVLTESGVAAFATAPATAPSRRGPEPRAFQRWNVEEAVSAQDDLLRRLEGRRRRAGSNGMARRSAPGLSFRDLIRAGGDIAD